MTAATPLPQVRIVLCDTLEPGNIGAVARAMKTMGLADLRLVRPQQYPHGSAIRLAVSAGDVLERAQVEPDLATAIAGCTAAYGVSARQRRIPLRRLWPREAAREVLAVAGDVALVFGGEEAGLGNEDLSLCGARIEIPSDPACRSLNLAAAVQLVCYELRLAALDARRPATVEYAPSEAFDEMLGALDETLQQAGWYANKNRALALEKLRRLLQRARPDRGEVQLLRGAIERLRRP